MTVFQHHKTQDTQEDINMADQTKPVPEYMDVVEKSTGHELNAAQEENAVGYKEYIEGRDIDIPEQEVSLFSCSTEHALITISWQ
jgi:hypothetical protein